MGTGTIPMLKIYFVKYYDKGSTIMGADQIADALRERGVEAWSVYPRDVKEVRDAILVFIKTSKLPDLMRARLNRNRTVLDVQDTVVFKRRIKNAWLFDGAIFKNERQLRDFSRPGWNSRVIYHQWDPRYLPHEVGDGELRVAYLGTERSIPEGWDGMGGVPCHGDDYFRVGLEYNCHVSVREPGKDFLYKPNCKVSTAAACGANLITTRDESALEMLGPDYPFYIEPTLESLRAGIERARAAIGGPDWQRGLEKMREIRERTSIQRVLDDYLDYFESLG
jgi:hypothetical protein